MSWGKLCGSYAFHRKVLEVGNEATGAHARMISYAVENLTGGDLTRSVALTIAPQAIIDRLVEVTLLDVKGDGYFIHDFGDYNPTGEDLAARRAELRAKRAEYGRRGAAALWSKRDGKGDGKPNGKLPSTTGPDGKRDGKNMATSPSPSPSSVPVPDPEKQESLALAVTEQPQVTKKQRESAERAAAQQAVFDAWKAARQERYPNTRGHSPRLDDDRRAAVDAALKLEYTVEQLKLAVVGFVRDRSRDRTDPRTFVWALQDASSIDAGIECGQGVVKERSVRDSLDCPQVGPNVANGEKRAWETTIPFDWYPGDPWDSANGPEPTEQEWRESRERQGFSVTARATIATAANGVGQ